MDDFDTVTNLRSSSVEDFQAYSKQSPCVNDKDALNSSPPVSAHHQSHDAAEESGSLPDSPRGHYSSADDEAVFDRPLSRHSSPGTSHDSSDEEISVLLESISAHDSRHVSGAPFTPSKTHSPFHHPSSVRAMQLDTTPPHLATPSSQRKRFHTPSRQISTPRSTRSGHRSTPSRLMNSSPVKTIKKEHPLVLLHITLLPSHNYSLELLEAVLPPAIFANWKLLHERSTSTVLQRGILIPHPREDYDILEERVLESLGLKESRILKCGHFHLSPEEEADIEASEDEEEEEDLDDVDICNDCGRRIRDGRYGDAGTGSKRWDVKVFAANGLMRAGAWNAAWREMERIDIEIVPWMEESMKRELEQRSEEEERFRREQDALRKEEGIAGLDDERLREIYGQDTSIRGTPAKEQHQDNADRVSLGTPSSHYAGFEKSRSASQPSFSTKSVRQQRDEIPLWELLRNYIYLAVLDPRNIAIWLLSIVVIFLALRSPSVSPGSSVSTPFETSNPIAPAATFSTTPTPSKDSAISATTDSSTTESFTSVSMSEALLLDDDEIVLGD